jgi:molecular chaperone Hsp33
MDSKGKILRCITKDASVLAVVMDSTAIVSEAERIHKTSAVVTAALGRLLTAASMMGIMLKGENDSLTLKVNGGGPVGTLMAVSDSGGNPRGYASNPIVEIPLREDGKLDVGTAVGKDGLICVMRDTGGHEPYIGCSPLVSGEITEDITKYYASSEQIPTVCSLGVLINPNLTVKAAGGLLIQLLPNCPDSVISRLEQNIQSLPPMTAMIGEGMSLVDIFRTALNGFEIEITGEYRPEYRCMCSREKVSRVFATMTPDQLRELPDEKGTAEVICQFCNKAYYFTSRDLEGIIRQSSPKG